MMKNKEAEKWRDNYQDALNAWNEEITIRQKAEAERDALKAEIEQLHRGIEGTMAVLAAGNGIAFTDPLEGHLGRLIRLVEGVAAQRDDAHAQIEGAKVGLKVEISLRQEAQAERDHLRLQLDEVWKEYDAYKVAHQRKQETADDLRCQPAEAQALINDEPSQAAHWRQYANRCNERMLEAQADSASTRAALDRYGSHSHLCTGSIEAPCDCGFIDALAQPHLGAPLLEGHKAEIDRLRNYFADALISVKAGMTDAAVELLSEALDAIRNREGRNKPAGTQCGICGWPNVNTAMLICPSHKASSNLEGR